MKKWLPLLPAVSLLVDTQAAIFDFSTVRQQAAALAAAPFKPTTNELPAALAQFQLPTDTEFLDNITTFWVPAQPPKPGSALDLEYEVVWTRDEPLPRKLGHVTASRIGRVVTVPAKTPPHLRFVVDFGGEAVESLPAKVQLAAKIDFGQDVEFISDSLVKNQFNQTWRLVIEIADPGKAVDLRAYLKRGEQQITETWTFTWQP